MLIYKNTEDKDVTITLEPKEGEEVATTITIKPGEEYEVPAEQARGFVAWMLGATKDGDSAPEGEANEDEPADDADNGEAETVAVKNDREFDVTVTYTENGEEKTATIKAGDEIEVPADQAEAVKQQIADAEAEEDEDGDNAKEEGAGETEDADEDEGDGKEDENDEKSEIAKEKAALAEEKRALLAEKAEMKFNKLCESGKLVPAQKEAYMALAAHEGEVALAEGKTESVSTLLENLLESAPAHRLMEEEGKTGEDEDKTDLSDEDKEVAERLGVSIDELQANNKEN